MKGLEFLGARGIRSGSYSSWFVGPDGFQEVKQEFQVPMSGEVRKMDGTTVVKIMKRTNDDDKAFGLRCYRRVWISNG